MRRYPHERRTGDLDFHHVHHKPRQHPIRPQVPQPPRPQDPAYRPQDPVYKPQDPIYKPQESVYRPQEPVYKPQESVYRPQESVYRPQEPVYRPQEPVYKPQDPIYKPQEPVYRPQDPIYKPQDPAYRPQDPVYRPQEPVYRPQDPVYRPQEPVYRPQERVYNPQDPAYKPQDSVYRPQQTGYQPQPVWYATKPQVPPPSSYQPRPSLPGYQPKPLQLSGYQPKPLQLSGYQPKPLQLSGYQPKPLQLSGYQPRQPNHGFQLKPPTLERSSEKKSSGQRPCRAVLSDGNTPGGASSSSTYYLHSVGPGSKRSPGGSSIPVLDSPPCSFSPSENGSPPPGLNFPSSNCGCSVGIESSLGAGPSLGTRPSLGTLRPSLGTRPSASKAKPTASSGLLSTAPPSVDLHSKLCSALEYLEFMQESVQQLGDVPLAQRLKAEQQRHDLRVKAEREAARERHPQPEEILPAAYHHLTAAGGGLWDATGKTSTSRRDETACWRTADARRHIKEMACCQTAAVSTLPEHGRERRTRAPPPPARGADSTTTHSSRSELSDLPFSLPEDSLAAAHSDSPPPPSSHGHAPSPLPAASTDQREERRRRRVVVAERERMRKEGEEEEEEEERSWEKPGGGSSTGLDGSMASSSSTLEEKVWSGQRDPRRTDGEPSEEEEVEEEEEEEAAAEERGLCASREEKEAGSSSSTLEGGVPLRTQSLTSTSSTVEDKADGTTLKVTEEESLTAVDKIEEHSSSRSFLLPPEEAHHHDGGRRTPEESRLPRVEDPANVDVSLTSVSGDTSGALSGQRDGLSSRSTADDTTLRQYLKDEDERLRKQSSLLRRRQEAMEEKTRTQLAWLQHQKKGLRDKGEDHSVPAVRAKQKGLKLKLRQETAEIRRLQEANRDARKARRLLLKQQEDIERMRASTLRLKERLRCAGGGQEEEALFEITVTETTLVSEAASLVTREAASAVSGRSETNGGGSIVQQQQQKEMHSHHTDKKEQQEWKQRLDREEAEVRRLEQEALAAWDHHHNAAVGPSSGLQRHRTGSEKENDCSVTPPESSVRTERSAAQSTERSAAQSTERSAAQSTERSAAQSTERSAAQRTERSAAQRTERSAAQSTERSAAQSTERSAAQSTERSAAQSTERSAAQSTERSAAQSTERSAAQASEGLSAPPESVPEIPLVSKQSKPSSYAQGVSSASPSEPSVPAKESLSAALSPSNISDAKTQQLCFAARTAGDAQTQPTDALTTTQTEPASDHTDIESRIRALKEELRECKSTAHRLQSEQRKRNRERLKAQEASLLKQLESYNHIIERTTAELNKEPTRSRSFSVAEGHSEDPPTATPAPVYGSPEQSEDPPTVTPAPVYGSPEQSEDPPTVTPAPVYGSPECPTSGSGRLLSESLSRPASREARSLSGQAQQQDMHRSVVVEPEVDANYTPEDQSSECLLKLDHEDMPSVPQRFSLSDHVPSSKSEEHGCSPSVGLDGDVHMKTRETFEEEGGLSLVSHSSKSRVADVGTSALPDNSVSSNGRAHTLDSTALSSETEELSETSSSFADGYHRDLESLPCRDDCRSSRPASPALPSCPEIRASKDSCSRSLPHAEIRASQDSCSRSPPHAEIRASQDSCSRSLPHAEIRASSPPHDFQEVEELSDSRRLLDFHNQTVGSRINTKNNVDAKCSPAISHSRSPLSPVPDQMPCFNVGDRVPVSNVQPGSLKSGGFRAGVELDESEGGSNGGTRDNVVYLECEESRGVFIPPNKITWLPEKFETYADTTEDEDSFFDDLSVNDRMKRAVGYRKSESGETIHEDHGSTDDGPAEYGAERQKNPKALLSQHGHVQSGHNNGGILDVTLEPDDVPPALASDTDKLGQGNQSLNALTQQKDRCSHSSRSPRPELPLALPHDEQQQPATVVLHSAAEVERLVHAATREIWDACQLEKKQNAMTTEPTLGSTGSYVVPKPSREYLGEEADGTDLEAVACVRSYRRAVFDLTWEILREVFYAAEHPDDVHQSRRAKPRHFHEVRTARHLGSVQEFVTTEALKLYGLQEDDRSGQETSAGGRQRTTTLRFGAKKRDGVDLLLVQELREDEARWLDYYQDELAVKTRLADGVFDALLKDSMDALTRIYRKRAEADGV